MPLRPDEDVLNSLRITLQKLEQDPNVAQNAESLAAFKNIILNRIADLEMAATLAPPDSAEAPPPAPSDLVPPASIAQDEPQQGAATGSPELEKLD
jgi:hypothetical protein